MQNDFMNFLEYGRITSLLEFRRSLPDEDVAGEQGEIMDLADRTRGISGIKCPICRWRPRTSDRWTCWDCEYPEYFYQGCGTEWNTFETGGECPTCFHQWVWTSCLSCWGWSKHEDWYESEETHG